MLHATQNAPKSPWKSWIPTKKKFDLKKEDSLVFIFWTMKILFFKKLFFHGNEFSIHLDNETRDYDVSIDFYDHQIDSIIGPTMKSFDVENKLKMPKCVKLFILHLEYFHCGRYCAINFKLMKHDWNKMISCSILYWY